MFRNLFWIPKNLRLPALILALRRHKLVKGCVGGCYRHRIKISNRRATQRCNVSAFFYVKICSLLARRRSSQPVQRVYWPENVIDWLGKWRPTCVMRHARGQKLQSFRRKWPFYMDLYSMLSSMGVILTKSCLNRLGDGVVKWGFCGTVVRASAFHLWEPGFDSPTGPCESVNALQKIVGFLRAVPVSSHRESWQGGLG
jgi:hypothetical protein